MEVRGRKLSPDVGLWRKLMSTCRACSELFFHWASQNLWVNICDCRPRSAWRRVWILFVRIRIGPGGQIREVAASPEWLVIWWHVMNLLWPQTTHRVTPIHTSHFRPRLNSPPARSKPNCLETFSGRRKKELSKTEIRQQTAAPSVFLFICFSQWIHNIYAGFAQAPLYRCVSSHSSLLTPLSRS